MSALTTATQAKVEHESEFVLDDRVFRVIAAIAREHTGIVLGENKKTMVYSRLVRRLRALKLDSFSEYCDLLQGPNGANEIGPLTNAITTNLTKFFRESHHFDHLNEVGIPAAIAADGGRRRLRIWSSACSTGEEAYSIAMVLAGHAPRLAGWDIRVLATDLDTSVLATAKAGVYSDEVVANVPQGMRKQYLRSPGKGDRWQVAEQLRAQITFNQLNLLGQWPFRGPFDAIFCRNVMIYFDTPTKQRLVSRMVEKLKPGGWLYIGHSETLLDHQSDLRLAGRTIYQKVTDAKQL